MTFDIQLSRIGMSRVSSTKSLRQMANLVVINDVGYGGVCKKSAEERHDRRRELEKRPYTVTLPKGNSSDVMPTRKFSSDL